mmetsp:Transcript_92238/g.261115  ORF Transcript_92238/g.261115 Transcript_92238/m.261115 type:complete len:201 (-) Transcript_92238:108-710(-)
MSQSGSSAPERLIRRSAWNARGAGRRAVKDAENASPPCRMWDGQLLTASLFSSPRTDGNALQAAPFPSFASSRRSASSPALRRRSTSDGSSEPTARGSSLARDSTRWVACVDSFFAPTPVAPSAPSFRKVFTRTHATGAAPPQAVPAVTTPAPSTMLPTTSIVEPTNVDPLLAAVSLAKTTLASATCSRASALCCSAWSN